MARSAKKSGSGMNKHMMIVAFCVFAGVAVTACQPELMNNDEKVAPSTESTQMSSPSPTGLSFTETESSMKPDITANPIQVNAKIDTSLKTLDASMYDGDPKDVSGADLN